MHRAMPVPVVAINVDSSVSSAPTNILVADGSHVAAGRWKGGLLPLSEPLSWELMSYRGSRVTRRRWNPGCDGAISITPWALGVRRHLLGGSRLPDVWRETSCPGRPLRGSGPRDTPYGRLASRPTLSCETLPAAVALPLRHFVTFQTR